MEMNYREKNSGNCGDIYLPIEQLDFDKEEKEYDRAINYSNNQINQQVSIVHRLTPLCGQLY